MGEECGNVKVWKQPTVNVEMAGNGELGKGRRSQVAPEEASASGGRAGGQHEDAGDDAKQAGDYFTVFPAHKRRMVPEEGVEPTCPRGRQILSLLRLPFRHSG